MKVLVGCEFSGVVRDAFRAAGHDAWSCDLLGPDDLPDEFRNQRWPNYHLEGDLEWFLPGSGQAVEQDWDLLIAHPPCTYLCNSGVRWLYGGKGKARDPQRWSNMETSARFFRRLLDCRVPKVCVENPIMHGYAREIVGRGPDQIVQPWQFGHGETKATGLWLKGLPPLKPTRIVEGRLGRVHHESPGPLRWLRRSVTYRGIASAMVRQWGK